MKRVDFGVGYSCDDALVLVLVRVLVLLVLVVLAVLSVLAVLAVLVVLAVLAVLLLLLLFLVFFLFLFLLLLLLWSIAYRRDIKSMLRRCHSLSTTQTVRFFLVRVPPSSVFVG